MEYFSTLVLIFVVPPMHSWHRQQAHQFTSLAHVFTWGRKGNAGEENSWPPVSIQKQCCILAHGLQQIIKNTTLIKLSTVALYGNSDPMVWFLERSYRGVFKILWHASECISFCMQWELDFGNPEICRWSGLLWRRHSPHLLIHKLVTAVVTGDRRWQIDGKGSVQGKPYEGQWGTQRVHVGVSRRYKHSVLRFSDTEIKTHRSTYLKRASYCFTCSAPVQLCFYEPIKSLQVMIQLFSIAQCKGIMKKKQGLIDTCLMLAPSVEYCLQDKPVAQISFLQWCFI